MIVHMDLSKSIEVLDIEDRDIEELDCFLTFYNILKQNCNRNVIVKHLFVFLFLKKSLYN